MFALPNIKIDLNLNQHVHYIDRENLQWKVITPTTFVFDHIGLLIWAHLYDDVKIGQRQMSLQFNAIPNCLLN